MVVEFQIVFIFVAYAIYSFDDSDEFFSAGDVASFITNVCENFFDVIFLYSFDFNFITNLFVA